MTTTLAAAIDAADTTDTTDSPTPGRQRWRAPYGLSRADMALALAASAMAGPYGAADALVREAAAAVASLGCAATERQRAALAALRAEHARRRQGAA